MIYDILKFTRNSLLKHPSTLTTKAAFRSFLTLVLSQGLIIQFRPQGLASYVH